MPTNTDNPVPILSLSPALCGVDSTLSNRSRHMKNRLSNLRKYLYKVGPGVISDTSCIEHDLEECWYEFSNSDAEGMDIS